VTKFESVKTRVVCRDCGLESDASHANSRECVEALQRECSRLRENLQHGQSHDTAISEGMSDRDNANAMSPRLAPICEPPFGVPQPR
jgi:hypothetical protein